MSPTPTGAAAQVMSRARSVLTPFARRVRPVTGVVTSLGWTVLGVGLAAWVLGWRLGWKELLLIAATCLIVLVLSTVFLLGRASLRVEVELEPRRVVVGKPAAGRVTITNASRRRLLPLRVEVPVGAGTATFAVPSLGGRDQHEEIFVVPTHRRAVIPVGPASSVRGDPLGLLRRQVAWTEMLELIVHPRVVALESLGAGLLRDLEGRTTGDISMSDLAFHALRDYVPGDDVRYVHWRTSARIGKLMVRQFVDTRRSHLTVVVDGSPDSYGDDEFEDAISVAASLVIRVTRDEQEATVIGAGANASGKTAQRLMDALARTELSDVDSDLSTLAGRARRSAPGTSVAILISGSRPSFADFRAAAARFPAEVNVLAVRVDPHAASTVTSAGGAVGIDVLSMRQLTDLPNLLRAARP
jgi:uncharacterized protein (DUF58 family)